QALRSPVILLLAGVRGRAHRGADILLPRQLIQHYRRVRQEKETEMRLTPFPPHCPQCDTPAKVAVLVLVLLTVDVAAVLDVILIELLLVVFTELDDDDVDLTVDVVSVLGALVDLLLLLVEC